MKRIVIIVACIVVLIMLSALLTLRLSQSGMAHSSTGIIPAPKTASNAAAFVAGGPHKVKITSNIPYATVDGKTLTLDLYQPEGVTLPMPVVVYTHSGGFRVGNSEVKSAKAFGPVIASHGYTFATINYELSGEATIPAPIYDDF